MTTGVVDALNSSLIVIGQERWFLGEQKAEDIEVGDTVEYEASGSFLTKLELKAKKNGATPAKKTAAASKNRSPAPTCVKGPCPDNAENFIFNDQRNRWECKITGMDNPNITNCPLVPKKVTGAADPAGGYDEKAQKAGFGTSPPAEPKTQVQVTGIYLGNNKQMIMLTVEGKNNAYPATPDLIAYLNSKECLATPDQPATLTMEPKKDGSGLWATAIGPGPNNSATEQNPSTATQQQQPSGEAASRPNPAPAATATKPPVTAANVSGPSFRKAVRKSAKLRVGLCGTAGSGKTFTGLLIGFGIGGPIAVIDTENSSAELYAHLGEYDVCVLQAPFTAQKYTDAIHAAERAGYNVIIIDSLSHAWAGEGGLLDLKDNIAKTSKSGNSFTAWKDVTPLHRGLVDAMLQSPCHIIATMRSKTEYVIDTDDRGRSFPRKIGMAPVQREGMDYEFTLVFDIDAAHIATASKDRTSLFTGKSFQPSAETGRQLREWLDTDTSAGGA